MPTVDASSAECLVFTYKEGLLSAVAHDLKLRVGQLKITVEGEPPAVVATFDAASLAVVAAVRDGADAPAVLSAKDRRDIEDNVRKDVLESRRFQEIRFTSTAVERVGDEWRIQGRLAIKDRERALTVPVRRVGDRWVAEVTLHQPDYGIKPFSAMLGTMKVKPDVKVRVSIAVAALPA